MARPKRSVAKQPSVKSTPPANRGRPPKATTSLTEIPSTSDLDEGSEIELLPTSTTRTTRSTSKSVLQGVVIPIMSSSSSKLQSEGIFNDDTRNTTPNSFFATTSRDASTDYETPRTSMSTTPAISSKAKGKGKAIEMHVTLGKRTRSSHVVIDSDEEDKAELNFIERDAEFARMLQQEEYDAQPTESEPRKKQKTRHFLVDDSTSLDKASIEDSDVAVAGTSSFQCSSKATASTSSFVPKTPASSLGRMKLLTRGASSKARKTIEELSSESSDLSDPEDAFELEDTSMTEDSDSERQTPPPAASTPSVVNPTIRRRPLGQRRRLPQDHIEIRRDMRKRKERAKLEASHPHIKTMWRNLEAVAIIKPVQAPQPKSINRKLKSFQLEGLDWMIKQEKTQYKGGLLGDEMGMGKTIQAVSLIMSDYPAPEPTLVVVPPVALMQWSNEIREYTDGKLNVLIYHGTNSKAKSLSVAALRKYNVIMISYNSLESLYRKQSKGWGRGDKIIKEASPMHAIEFHRLILDEAHSIKQRTTGVAKACFALKGKYKWCLSGTPVQNRIGEFFSLLRFLEVRPFADYFCKRCDCAQLHWSLDATHRCSRCKHSGAEHVSVFNQELLNPITGDSTTLREAAMEKLHMITARIMLRRLKKDHTSSMELPPKEIIIHKEFFGEIELDFSTSIMTNSTRQFDTYVSRGVMLNNYANIFGLIMQMRQVANHPDLLLRKNADGGQNILVCNICDEPAEEAIRSRCKHEFCRSCIKNYVHACEAAGNNPDCPRCHIALAIDFDQPDIEQDEDMVKKSSIINRIKMGDWTSSTKIEMLIYDLYKLRSKKQTLKSIVFSQFTSMLQLIEWRLRRAGFNTVMLDGTMSPAQRQKSIEYFMNNTDVEVFLVSLKAGGVALNLTEASRVFIVDPWWNPAAEWQSADRCHRIGQKRPCVITRLCIEDSVESRMVLLQEKKAMMINGTINNDKVAMEKLTPEDLQFLFRGT